MHQEEKIERGCIAKVGRNHKKDFFVCREISKDEEPLIIEPMTSFKAVEKAAKLGFKSVIWEGDAHNMIQPFQCSIKCSTLVYSKYKWQN